MLQKKLLSNNKVSNVVGENRNTNNGKKAYYQYFDWLTQMHTDPEFLPDTEEVLALANSCPLKNGRVVYAVRNLYNAITNNINTFEDNCDNVAFRNSKTKPPAKFISLHPRKEIASMQEKLNTLKLYPNPAKTNITISGNKMKQIEIVDMLGRQVLTKQLGGTENATINISNLQRGLFLVRVIDANGKVSSHKLIIE